MSRPRRRSSRAPGILTALEGRAAERTASGTTRSRRSPGGRLPPTAWAPQRFPTHPRRTHESRSGDHRPCGAATARRSRSRRPPRRSPVPPRVRRWRCCVGGRPPGPPGWRAAAATAGRVFFFKQKTAYEFGLGIPAEPLFRSKEIQYLNAKGALTYTDIAGDPVLYGNLPPREISMKDVFRSGDSSKKFKIAEGQWYRYAPSYVSPAYHLLEGFPFIQEPP